MRQGHEEAKFATIQTLVDDSFNKIMFHSFQHLNAVIFLFFILRVVKEWRSWAKPL